MTCAPPRALTLDLKGPLARSELPGLYARACALLAEREVDVVLLWRCGCVAPDAVAVEALARLELAARRRGAEVRLRGASSALRQVVAFMGLAEALPDERA